MASHETSKSALKIADIVLKRLGRIPILLICLWVTVIWWGERIIFENSVESCQWHRWERWRPEAQPHHVLLVADPQLVDPHTYPGRPWPLSTLTVLYTDLYLRRSYRLLLENTEPDSTIFLGDLFDGGREWGAAEYKSPEERYKGYGTNFWLREYHRFMSIFIDGWRTSSMQHWPNEGGRRLITSLPGNHDLGFAGGINAQVKSRFDAHFGPLNRVDILGNHSFVSLDTVSLSAMDQVDPETGSSGSGDDSAAATKTNKIWRPVEDFLKQATVLRKRAISHYMRFLDSYNEQRLFPQRPKFQPQALDAADLPADEKQAPKDPLHVSTSQFPTIILSHVPFYRVENLDCGPLRENGRSLLLQAGYQYQNVLTPLVSKNIIEHLDAEQVTQIYSGDDHDYCEIDHSEFSGRIKEITVKSISWAMGVRKPGVQLVSLWNPVDLDKVTANPQSDDANVTPKNTVQNHLCLLPDQLSIFIRYAQVFGVTLVVLLVRAILHKATTQTEAAYSPLEKGESLLPTTRKITPPTSPKLRAHGHDTNNHSYDHSTSSISSSNSAYLGPTVRTNKLGGYGNLPPSSRSHSPVKETATSNDLDTDDWGVPLGLKYPKRVQTRHDQHWLFSFYKSQTRLAELRRSILHVGTPVLIFYAWVLWNG